MSKLTLGFSPCPNDTFIFDAMVHDKIDTEGLKFEPILEDVEKLNDRALQNSLMITKLSYHAMAFCLNNYQLLNSGSALGSGVGPLLVSKKTLTEQQITNAKIAIPGKLTTANFLLSIAFPEAKNKTEILFSEIESAVVNEKFDAGLIIHENRFTYKEKGLLKLIDLGEFWETISGNLIPLGGIVVNRKLENGLKTKVDRVLKRSIEFAFKNPKSSKKYVKNHSQEMDDKVIQKHIDLYVNQYSLDLGLEGRNAVEYLFNKAVTNKIIDEIEHPIFVEQ